MKLDPNASATEITIRQAIAIEIFVRFIPKNIETDLAQFAVCAADELIKVLNEEEKE